MPCTFLMSKSLEDAMQELTLEAAKVMSSKISRSYYLSLLLSNSNKEVMDIFYDSFKEKLSYFSPQLRTQVIESDKANYVEMSRAKQQMNLDLLFVIYELMPLKLWREQIIHESYHVDLGACIKMAMA